MTARSFALSGVLAGGVSVFVFTVIHHIYISDIWFSFAFMLAAGAVCGWSVAWSYGLLVSQPTIASWLYYNFVYDALFLVLALASVALFEPITSMAVVIAANEPPGELIAQATPLTVLFTVAAAGVVHLLFGRGWKQFGVLLLCWTLLVLLLGLNLSTLGLIAVPRSGWYLVAGFYGLVLVLNGVYVVAFMALERKSLNRRTDSYSHGGYPPALSTRKEDSHGA